MTNGEIWTAYVKFEDYPEEIKIRPVLITGKDKEEILVFKISSRKKRNHEVFLKDWHKEGLRKPSFVKTDKMIALYRTDFKEKIGDISMRDELFLWEYIFTNKLNMPYI